MNGCSDGGLNAVLRALSNAKKNTVLNNNFIYDVVNSVRDSLKDYITDENVDHISGLILTHILKSKKISNDVLNGVDLKKISELLLLKANTNTQGPKREPLSLQDVPEAIYNLRSKTFIDDFYKSSIASTYMEDQFTRDFVKSTLVNFDSESIDVVGDINEINRNLIRYLERLYRDLKFYIESDPLLSKVIKIPNRLFEKKHTSNFNVIFKVLDNIFTQKSGYELSRLAQSSNPNDLRLLEAINKYFTLKHFDLLIYKNFDDFIKIGEAYFGKHIYSKKKYVFNTKNDYQNAVSWRDDEIVTPREVMSHHLQHIIRTIKYFDGNNILHGYLDTDLVIYGVKAIKDIYLNGKINKQDNKDVIIGLRGLNKEFAVTKDGTKILYTTEELDWLKLTIGKTVRINDVINHFRDNSQLGYSILFKVLSSRGFKDNNSGLFLLDLTNIYNSLYRAVFLDNRLVKASPEIFLELTHFLDITTNLENSLYHLDDFGNWLIRTMNPMNIETNKFILRNSINSAHAAGQMLHLIEKYKVLYIDTNDSGTKNLPVGDKNITMEFTSKDGKTEYLVLYYPGRRGEDRYKVYKNKKPISSYNKDDYYNFKTFVKDALNINLYRDIDLEREIFRDSTNNFDKQINYNIIMLHLVNLSASVLGNAFIVRKSTAKRRRLSEIVRSWGLNGGVGRDADITFRNNLGTYNIVGLAESHHLSWLATRRGIAKRQLSKTTTRTAEKTTISANSLSTLSSERRNLYSSNGEESAVKRDMLVDLLGWGVNREVDLVTSGKLTHTFNFNELFYSSFGIDFLTGYKNANGVKVTRFVEAVNADKGNSPRCEVAYSDVFNENGTPKKAEIFYKKVYDDFGSIYLTAWKNILTDFSKLEQYVKLLNDQGIESIRIKLGLPSDFTIDVNNNFEKFNLIAKNLGTTGSELINKICSEYNYSHFNDPIPVIENVHKRADSDGGLELNRAFIDNLMRFNRNYLEDPNEPILDLIPNYTPELRQELRLLKGLETKLAKDPYWLNLLNLYNYFKRNEIRLVDDLLTEGATLNIQNEVTLNGIRNWKSILSSYSGWSKDGNMVFAKIKLVNNLGDIKFVDVNDYSDLIGFTSGELRFENGELVGELFTSDDARFDLSDNLQLTTDETTLQALGYEGYKVDDIFVHQALRSWTAADGYYTGKYLTANVGLTVFSDAKGAKNGRYEEEGAVGDYVKRNVINTATMKQFQLGTLGGITNYLNMAVVEDTKALLNNIVTDESKYKVWDGAIITNGLQHYWENNSLSGSITGYAKKPIMHHYFDKYAAGFLGKMASFGVNNEKMRDSILYRIMHLQMTDIDWRKEDGGVFDADITKSYKLDGNGNNIKISYDNCYYKKNGRYYRIKSIKKLNDLNKYLVVTIEVDRQGNTLHREVNGQLVESINNGIYTIKSNYDLWKLLGGYDSVSLDENTKLLEYSENSLKKVAEVANLVGIVNERLKTFTKDPTGKLIENTKVETQHGVYLFMKHSNIHYIATEGAIKKGAANVNKYEALKNGERLNFYRVKATLFGTQLDATHEADNSQVALMTQVISGLADRGFTTDAVNDVYNALGRLAREAIQLDIEDYKNLNANENLSSKEIEDKVAREIVEAFKNQLGNANNLINVISTKLSNLKFNESRSGKIPWSDSSIFNLILNTVTSTLNKMAIRVKSFGSLSVLNPAHDTMLLFNGKKLSEYSSPKALYEAGLKLDKTPVIKNHKLYIGHWYKYTDLSDASVKYVKMTLDEYYETIKKLDNNLISDLRETFLGKEHLIVGRDRDKNLFGLFRLKHIAKDYNGNVITGEDGKPKEVEIITYLNGKLEDPINRLTLKAEDYTEVTKIELLGRDLDTYNVFVNGGANTLYDLKSVRDRYDLRKRYEEISRLYKNGDSSGFISEGFKSFEEYTQHCKNRSHNLLRLIQADLIRIKNKNLVTFVDGNGNIKLDPNNPKNSNTLIHDYEINSYGILVPMIYKSKFGLRNTDLLSDIKDDREFFFKRLLLNYYDIDSPNKSVLEGNYDVAIKRLNNSNLYLQTKISNINNDRLKELKIEIFKDKNGRVFRKDMYGNKMYEMSSENDKVYIDYDNINNGEIIVTDDAGIKFYIDKYAQDAADIQLYKPNKNIGSETPQLYKLRIDSILKSTDLYKNDKEHTLTYDNLTQDDTYLVRSYFYYNDLKRSGMWDAILKSKRLKSLWRKSLRIRTSFQESLLLLAARIPAQSMLSFMTMKVEGFTNVDENNCYVSDMLVWLQGSDFDIDKVTLMGSAFNDFGEYKTWSKFMRTLTLKEFEITSLLKFPTGKEIKVTDSPSLDYYKYQNLFTTDGKLDINRPKSAADVNTYYTKLLSFVNMINEYSDSLSGTPSELRNNIQKVVNEHNTLKLRDVENSLMNLIQHRATSISKDIVNIIPSQNPIDVVSEPLKQIADNSNFGRKDKYNRYGNAVVKLKLLLINQTGKLGIAITAANGIKTFFGLTQFFNQRTLKKLSDLELNELIFDITIKGKEYHTISNINKIKAELDINPELKAKFNEYVDENNYTDADAVISGIMTLATDNAKELKLAKLNASSDILSLYLYGVTIGVPFDTLSEIFTSNTADVLNKRMRGNVFTEESDTQLKRVINLLKTGPFLPMNEGKPNGYIMGLLSYKYSGKVGEGFEKSIVLIFKNLRTYLSDEKYSLLERKQLFAVNVKGLLEEARRIDGSKNTRILRYKEEVILYIKDMYKIYGDGNFERNDLTDIELLLLGSLEIALLRSLILNQGVKVLLEDKLSFYDSFSNILEQRLPKDKTNEDLEGNRVKYFISRLNNNSRKIDIVKYATNDTYKQGVIDAYEDVKHTINPFKIIDGLPHFKEYLLVAADDAIKLNSSSVFKAMREYSNFVFDLYLVYGKKQRNPYYKRMRDFYIRKILDKFLLNIKIKLDEGSVAYEHGMYMTYNGSPEITLGTPQGNAAFKLWVESKVIPNIQGEHSGYFTDNNTFISDLIPKMYTKTLSGNRIRSISLPSDMIPKTETELKIFDRYLMDFNAASYITYHSDRRYSIADILYLYNMITYANARDLIALTSVTDALYSLPKSIADKYISFLADFDSNYKIVLEGTTKDIKYGDIVISKDELLQQVAPDSFEVLNKRKFRGPYVRLFNYDTATRELRKLKESVILLDKKDYENRKNKLMSDADGYLDMVLESWEYDNFNSFLDDSYVDRYDNEEFAAYDESFYDLVDREYQGEEYANRNIKNPLDDNYELLNPRVFNIDTKALEILGRFLANTRESIPDILSEQFSKYLEYLINTQVKLDYKFPIYYLTSGKYDLVNVDITKQNDIYKVKIDNVEHIVESLTRIENKRRISDINTILLYGLINDRIQEKSKIPPCP